MKRTTVVSTNVDSVGYDRESRTLEIAFLSGGVYQYDNVPPSVHTALLQADSIGAYVNTVLKKRYRSRQVG